MNVFVMNQITTCLTKGLQGLAALISKLTSGKKLGKIVRFRTAPVFANTVDPRASEQQSGHLFSRHESLNIPKQDKSRSPPRILEPKPMTNEAIDDRDKIPYISEEFHDDTYPQVCRFLIEFLYVYK